jgi:hypothetical protein
MSGKLGQKSNLSTQVPSRYTRKSLFRLLDGRSKVARLLRDRRAVLTVGLGGEGERAYEDDSLLDRFLSLEAVIAQQETSLSNGEPVDLAAYLSGLNTFLGMKKQISALRRVVAAARDEHDPLLIEHDEASHG